VQTHANLDIRPFVLEYRSLPGFKNPLIWIVIQVATISNRLVLGPGPTAPKNVTNPGSKAEPDRHQKMGDQDLSCAIHQSCWVITSPAVFALRGVHTAYDVKRRRMRGTYDVVRDRTTLYDIVRPRTTVVDATPAGYMAKRPHPC